MMQQPWASLCGGVGLGLVWESLLEAGVQRGTPGDLQRPVTHVRTQLCTLPVSSRPRGHVAWLCVCPRVGAHGEGLQVPRSRTRPSGPWAAWAAPPRVS